MATVSARVDDEVKIRAEQVADAIGLPLSAAINIFLKKFAAEGGFPFEVKAIPQGGHGFLRDSAQLERMVQRAVADPNNPARPKQFTYLDPETNEPVVVTQLPD